MGFTTEDQIIKSAKKKHVCDWCGQLIEIGSAYIRYRWFNYGDALTVKLHPECHAAMHKLVETEGQIEFSWGENPRGHFCGWARGWEENECGCITDKEPTP